MTNARIATATSETPYLVSRRLRRLSGAELGRRDRHALAWIEQAADLIDKLAKERQSFILLMNNQSRARCKVVRIRSGKPVEVRKVDAEPKVGKVVKAGPNQAEAIADMIVGTVDLYRAKNGGIRVVKAGAKVKRGEFLGRFDEGADFQDIKDAIE